MRVFRIESGAQGGFYNMALDEALLEWLRSIPATEPHWVVRTYLWQEPTLSLGVNQAVRDIRFLMSFYGKERPVNQIVRRPTGGRAILHGEDISYSFLTNDPAILRQSLHEAYALLSGFVRETLLSLDLPVAFSGEENQRDYLRSPVCFETHTASDLVAKDGHKLSGSAQLRRSGGLLQHGAAFLQPYGIPDTRFSATLFETVGAHFGQSLEAFPLEAVQELLATLQVRYEAQASEILDSALTTNGSHLTPASP